MLFGKIPFVQGKPNSLCLPIILEQLQLWTSSGIDMPNEKPESLELTNKELQSQDIELVWNRLSGGSEVKLAATWDNKEKTLGEMWESFRQGIDNYIEKFDVPADLEPNETVGKFAVRVLEKMREINKGKGELRSWAENPTVSMEMADGAFNCIFGGQIAARAMERAGFEAFMGLPARHGGTVIKASEDDYWFLDVSNTEILKLEPVEDSSLFPGIHMGHVAEILYGRSRTSYEYIPIVAVEQSTAATINNFGSLRDIASKKEAFARQVADFLKLSEDAPYNSAKAFFIPGMQELRHNPLWIEETKKVREKQEEIRTTYLEGVDKITLENRFENDTCEILREIEQNGAYLFHGSRERIDVLEPRQAKDNSNSAFKNSLGVFANTSALRAIASAIMPNRTKLTKGDYWGTIEDNQGNVTVKCSNSVREKIGDGFVHVLGNKNQALQEPITGSTQYRYDTQQESKLVVPVTVKDFEKKGGRFEITA